MKKKNGFTIIELLAVIFILSLIPILFISSFGNNTENLKNEKNEISDSILKDAIEVYYHIGMKEKTIDYRIEGSATLSCISIKELISKGYILEEQYNPDNYIKIREENDKLESIIVDTKSACE